jgi:uncharacterized spore protein YtfJ
MNDKSFVERIADIIQVNANARQVFGEPVERDGTTVIPVARVQWGFGGGGLGRGSAERGGGGGGARSQAIGYIELRDGKSEFRAIHDPGDIGTLVAIGAAGIIAGFLMARLAR